MEKVGSDFIFQQDCASVHTAKTIKDWFRAKNVRYLDWPSKSLDLNITENLWGKLVRLVYANGKQYNTQDELKHGILASLAKIEKREIKPLYDSLPKRIFEVIKARGGSTKY